MWRANACPLWLFAPLAGWLVWNRMEQALVFLGVRVPDLEAILTSFILFPAGFPKCPRNGVEAWG